MRRPDFSGALVHLTRAKTSNDFLEAPRVLESAFDVLTKILRERRIIGGLGFVKGRRPVVCLSEIPLSLVRLLSEHNARYTQYGIVVSKQAAFAQGGRPVIYLPDAEGNWISECEKWRHVRFEPDRNVDHTYEREWRVPGEIDLAKVPGFYVLVRTEQEEADLRANAELRDNCLGVLVMNTLNQIL